MLNMKHLQQAVIPDILSAELDIDQEDDQRWNSEKKNTSGLDSDEFSLHY